MSHGSPVTAYVDCRSLQDSSFQFRGVGQHIAALLRGRPKNNSIDIRLVGLLSGSLPPLPEVHHSLFDEVSLCLNPAPKEPAIFIHASPMTHPADFDLPILMNRRILSAAVIYDFIPWDFEGYLPDSGARVEYITNLIHLRLCDLFFPISAYSARRLTEIAGVPASDIYVTGAPVRTCFRELKTPPASGRTPWEPYFVTVGGGDLRKNTEVAVEAVAALNRRGGGARARLVVVGQYLARDLDRLQKAAGQNGYGTFLEVRSRVSDSELRALYSGAIATIAPSLIEGFSLPVVEAAMCGCPVVASSCDAHKELVKDPEALFPAESAEDLAERLEVLRSDQALRDRILRQQKAVAARFEESRVQARFWEALFDRFESYSAPRVSPLRNIKPRVAFLSPFPPDESGVARFTDLTLQALSKLADVDLYTDAPRPIAIDGDFHDAGPVSRAVYSGDYDSVISVLGNSHFHTKIFELFEQYGGPCILHDSRLTQIYHYRFGPAAFLQMANEFTGGSYSPGDIGTWLQDQDPPTLFVEPVLDRADPLIVHTREFARLLKERYSYQAQLATFPPTYHFSPEELSRGRRAEARERLGIEKDEFAICSFGHVVPSKNVSVCLIALEFLRSWKIPATLHLVGKCDDFLPHVKDLARRYGVLRHVYLHDSYVSQERYRDYMLAADAAVQLRTYGFGQASAALADSISAGVPGVTTDNLGLACDAPAFVRRVPVNTSALLVAEALAEIAERPLDRAAHEQERQAYLREHSYERYAILLQEILGLQ